MIKKSEIIILNIIIFCLIIFKVNAFDSQELTVETTQSILLPIGKVDRYIITIPDIAKAESTENGLKIRGLQHGTTQLYLWQNNKVYTYVIKTNSFKGIPNARFIRAKYQKDKNSQPKGTINFQSGISANNNSNNQNLSNNINYEIPLNDESQLSLRSTVNINAENVTDFQKIFIQNINIGYKNKIFSTEIGDINYINPLFEIIPVSNSLKGIKLSLLNLPGNDLNFLSGISCSPFVFYDKRKYPLPSQELISVFTGNHMFSNNLNLRTSLLSGINLENNNKNYFNLSAGLSWKPDKNYGFSTNFGTNFLSPAFSGNTFYRFNWPKNGEWFELYGNTIFRGENYISDRAPGFNSYSAGFRAVHKSAIKLNGNMNIISNSNIRWQKNLNLKLEREFFDKSVSLHSLFFNQENNSIIRKGFQIGANSLFPFSSGLRYRYISNIQNNETDIHEFQGILRFPAIFGMKSALQGLFSNSNRHATKRGTPVITEPDSSVQSFFPDTYSQNMLNYNILWLMEYSFSKNFLLGLQTGYSRQNYDNTVSLDYLSTSLSSTFRLFNNNFNFSINYQKTLSGNNNDNISTLFGYSHSLGESETEKTKGEIKGVVFEDLNNNGLFDQDEKIVPGIKVMAGENNVITKESGFHFANLDYDYYQIFIDNNSLPEGYKVTTEKSKKIELSGNASEINFGIKKKYILKGFIFGGKNEEIPLPNIRFILDDSTEVFSDYSGYFEFETTPGKHSIKTDIGSLPKGYQLTDGFIKEVNLDNYFQEISFNAFPVISFEGTLKTSAKTKNKIIGQKINIKFTGEEENFEKSIYTDNNGKFFLLNLSAGELEISSPVLEGTVKIIIPPTPGDIKKEFKVF